MGWQASADAQVKIDSMIGLYSNRYGQERVYLHYDKSVYTPGETIWFKAYLMVGLEPSYYSKTLYVDFLAPNGAILQHTSSPLIESSAKGQFEIPATFKGKTIKVRAYTKWMLNFDSTFLYNKDLAVFQAMPAAAPAAAKKTSVKFLPEGGQLVAGLPGRVAFKAVDNNGDPSRITGIVKDASGKKIADLLTLHDGMGSFIFTPEAGRKYTAVWKDDLKKADSTVLQQAMATGATLAVTQDDEGSRVTVTRTADAPDNFHSLKIVATMFQQLVYRASLNMTERTTAGGVIPTDQFPSGVMIVTVFDANWKPLLERAVFVNNKEYIFKAKTNVALKGLGKHNKNVVEISVPDTVGTNLSLSVTDGGLLYDSTYNIFTGLLLTGELRGKINNPAAFLVNNADSTQRKLDLVMLTNGWRSYNWTELLAGRKPVLRFLPDSTYVSINGKVSGANATQLREAKEINIILRTKDSSTQFMSMPLRGGGEFGEPNALFFDTITLYYQFNNKRDLTQSVDVAFNSGLFTQELAKLVAFVPPGIPVVPDTAGNARLAQFAREEERLRRLLAQGNMLENVTVTSRKKSPVQLLDEKYTNGMFSGGDAYQFDVMNDPFGASSFNVLQYLQSRVAGLQISNDASNPGATWRGSNTSFFLDEMPVDAQQVINIPMADVAYIKVLRPPFMGAAGGGAGGAIAVYTRKGGDRPNTPGKGLEYKRLAGYTPIKNFYSPDYSSVSGNTGEADIRTTLYWNPFLFTDAKNKTVQVTFYNNDISRSYRIVLEGVNKEGRMVHLEQMVQ